MPIDLLFHPTINREQDTQIFELFYLKEFPRSWHLTMAFQP